MLAVPPLALLEIAPPSPSLSVVILLLKLPVILPMLAVPLLALLEIAPP